LAQAAFAPYRSRAAAHAGASSAKTRQTGSSAAALRYVKAPKQKLSLKTFLGVALLTTYTFYLRDGAAHSRFEPGMYATAPQAMAHARELLRANSECEAIDVFLGEDLVFRVARPRAG